MDGNAIAIAVLENEIKAIREAIDLRFAATEKALELQAIEYDRRMTTLNHETSRMSNYVPRETWETQHAAVTKDINNLQNFQANMAGRLTIIAAVISVAVSIGMGLLVIGIK